MTRDEALTKLLEANVPGNYSALVDGLAALGLLTLEAPKTPVENLCAALNWGEHNSKILNETLAECGLKVVRA